MLESAFVGSDFFNWEKPMKNSVGQSTENYM